MATRQERMRDRMRGAGRHNVGDIDFGFVIPLAEPPPDEPQETTPSVEDDEPSPASPPPGIAPPTRHSPNTSAKRKRLDSDASRLPPPPPPAPQHAAEHDIYSLPDHSTDAGDSAAQPQLPQPPLLQPDEDDQPMPDAPSLPPSARPHTQPRPPPARGPLSSVISATRRLAIDPSPLPLLPPPPPITQSPRPIPSPAVAMAMDIEMEMEVTESPADAPGSGRRRPLRPGAATPAIDSSALLQKVLADVDADMDIEGEDGEDGDTTQRHGLVGDSSPIERRLATRRMAARRKNAAAAAAAAAKTAIGAGGVRGGKVGSSSPVEGRTRRSARVVASSVVEVAESEIAAVDEESVEEEEPEEEVEQEDEEPEEDVQQEEDAEQEEEDVGMVEAAGSSPAPVEERPAEAEREEEEEEEEEQEQAEEVREEEVAQRLGTKRLRRSPRGLSPELGSGRVEESPAPPTRRKRRQVASPAQQQQPAKRARARQPTKPQPPPQPPRQPSPASSPPPQRQAPPQQRAKPKAAGPQKKPVQKRKKKPAAAPSEDETEPPSGSVPVAVQRFAKPPRASAGTDGSPTHGGEIPFSSRGGVNAVDVLSTLCEELIEAYLGKLEERGRAAEDATTRREHKTMYRALEAFREELRTRLLEHTIALDTLHSLRKRVRAAQKEKLALRTDILRIRAEREQVALRMDAIRIRHEADSKEALRQISLSSAMHDIDLAVEKGHAAPDLSPTAQRKADLANLELLISRVADQACSRSEGGGALRQIKEFNAFLERAAAVLEGR
ncbi:hypothetical protein VTJ49DRAFT_6795 [Mycothermus thermophilus]|uniref:Inner kinetochore subunit AME1 domain-containing protein n=1 Tax=Humicola insolens TaxID=85995 RepID=A0ABR3VIT9_HUMIN